MKNSAGLETTHESLSIIHIVTNEDRSLKVKKVEDSLDSRVYLANAVVMATAVAAAHANK